MNEQLGQLYVDMQLEGGAAWLTLEEDSSSSGEEGSSVQPATKSKKVCDFPLNRVFFVTCVSHFIGLSE